MNDLLPLLFLAVPILALAVSALARYVEKYISGAVQSWSAGGQKETNVAELCIKQKIKRLIRAADILFGAFVLIIYGPKILPWDFVYFLLDPLASPMQMTVLLYLVTPLILAFMILNILAIDYRVRKGFYGTNPYEAKELIHFILDNSQNNDLPGGGGGKILIDPEEIARLAELGEFEGVKA